MSHDGRLVDLGLRQARSLLAVLALQSGSPVRSAQLAEALWPGGPPARWEAAVHSHVSRLRRALEPERAPRAPSRRLTKQGDSYVLQLDGDELDARRFETLASEARLALSLGEHRQAEDLFTRALAEWRGPVLADFKDPQLLSPEVSRLEELRVLALEERAETVLALGNHRSAVAELEALVAAHPLRERGWELLLLALYRSGRQSEAVRRYQEVRRLLVDELGIEPGPGLRSLEGDILRHEDRLVPSWDPSRATSRAELPLPGWLQPPDDLFVGRKRELDVLRSSFERCEGGQRRLALMVGEPGIGKSRLLREASRELWDAGALVLGGRCVEEPLHVLEPFAEAIDALATTQAERLARESPGDTAVLAGLVPELSLHAPPFTVADAETHRYLLFRAVSNLLDERHLHRPSVLVLDDLQWAAPVSLQLLSHLLCDDDRGPLLVLATVRDTEPNEHLADLVTDLRRQRRLDQISMEGLDATEVQALASDRGADTSVSDFFGLTEGNPFYVEELVRHLAESGGALGPDALPESVRDTIARRLLRLPEIVRRVLGTAAVAGGAFRLDVVARAAQLDIEPTDDALTIAARAGIVVEQRSPVGTYCFSHALIYAVLRDGLGAARRARVHRRIGEAIAELGGPRSEVARHLLAAAADGSAIEPGVEASLLAARGAVERYTYDDAVSILRPAWEGLTARPVADPVLVCRVAIELASTLRRSGNYDERVSLLEEAWARAGEADSAELLCDVIVEGCAGTVSPSEPWPSRAEEVRARLDESSPARVHLTALLCHLCSGEPGDRAKHLAEWALARQARLAPEVRRAVAEHCLAVVAATSPIERVVDLARDALADARTSGNVFEVVEALSVLRRAYLAAADVSASEEIAREYEEMVRSVRIPRFMAGVEQRRAMLALLAGRFAEAEAHAFEAVALQPHGEFMEGLAVQVFAMRFEQGRLDEVRAEVESWASEQARPAWSIGLSALLAEVGEPVAAAEVLAPFAGNGFAAVPRDELYFLSLCAAASSVISTGDLTAAAALRELLSPHSSRVVVAAEGAVCWGSIHRFLGPLSAMLGDLARASMHFEAAISIHERLGARPFLARDRLGYATALHRVGGDPARIGELVRTGSALAEQYGLRMVAARFEELR